MLSENHSALRKDLRSVTSSTVRVLARFEIFFTGKCNIYRKYLNDSGPFTAEISVKSIKFTRCI